MLEIMNWRKFLTDPSVQVLIFVIINLIYLRIFHTSNALISLEQYFNYETTVKVPDIIALSTIVVLSIGVLYYAGVHRQIQEEYRLKMLGFSFKYQLAIMGGAFGFSILLSVILYVLILPIFPDDYYWLGLIIFIILVLLMNSFSYKSSLKKIKNGFEDQIAILLAMLIIITILSFIIKEKSILYYAVYYILVVSLLVILFGYVGEKNREKNNNIILKMIDPDESLENLELFDITDNDYRFKDLDENEFIVPIGRIQKITYHNVKQESKVKVMELGNKMKEKEEIRRFAETEFKNDLNKTYEQLGIDGYDEIFQENRNLPDNTNEQIRLLTLDNENMKHAMKRMFAFSAKTGLENQKTQEWIKRLTFVIFLLMIIQLLIVIKTW